MARWLAIDHGSRRLGVAVGDLEARIASPLTQLLADDEGLFDRIRQLAQEYAADGVVVGWPINQDDTEGPQGRRARRFARELARRTGLDVRMWDERLSSFEADQRLRGTLTRRKKRRRHDAVAAAAFLTDFLTRGGPGSAPRPSQGGQGPTDAS